MKTEPTEAYFKEPENTFREWIKSVKTIKENLLFIADNGRINGSLLLDVLKLMQRSFEEGQSSPKIKQLEWDFYGTYYSSETPVIDYMITQENDFVENDGDCALWVNGFPISHSTLAEAKAAAQADFERRVKECLE